MRRVRGSLEQAGLEVWTDEGIQAGTPSWQDAIQDAIEATGCVVVLLSPDAKQSRWVKSELAYAEIQEIRIFPVLVRGDERSSLPFSLASAHYADIRGDFKSAMQQLITAIRELGGMFEAVETPQPATARQALHRHPSDSISIVIVDDIQETREALRRLLAFDEDFDVIGEAANGREAIAIVQREQPNIVLMDINMPEMDGIEATTRITQAMPHVATIMVSVQSDSDYLRRSMVAGARGFLEKPVQLDQLYGTIRSVHEQNRAAQPTQAGDQTAVPPADTTDPSGPISIVLVDDIPETRSTMRKLLAFEPDFNVVGVARNGLEAIQIVDELRPDIVLMDIMMPEMDGIEATRRIAEAHPDVRVIMMTIQSDRDYMRRSMVAGARDYLVKPVKADELYATIRSVRSAL